MGAKWTAAECAAAWGVRPATWAGYVSRGQAPAPLPGTKLWDAEAVRTFPRPGVGHSRAGSGPEADAILARMQETSDQLAVLQARQRTLLAEGAEAGLETAAMARALGISRQTASSWLKS